MAAGEIERNRFIDEKVRPFMEKELIAIRAALRQLSARVTDLEKAEKVANVKKAAK